MESKNRQKVEQYMKKVFSAPSLKLQSGQGVGAPDEVFIDDEFIGVIYQNEDEGEISFDFNMSILAEDLD